MKTKNPVTKCYPQWVLNPGLWWTSDSKSNTLLSGLTWHVLPGRSLTFCSCTTWFLDLNDSVRINRAWQYKGPKVSVLQATVNLVQKGECWTWNQRFRCSTLIGGNIFHWLLCFHAVNSLCQYWQFHLVVKTPRDCYYSGSTTWRILVPWDPFPFRPYHKKNSHTLRPISIISSFSSLNPILFWTSLM